MFAPQLFAKCSGSHRCFWCGGPCGDSAPVRVSSTFWDWDAVADRTSPWQCAGCVEALDERRVMPGRDKPQKTRNYSWLFRERKKPVPYTKADLATLRKLCLKPPAGRWALSLAESGQKHIIYRTPVNLGGGVVAVQLELRTVWYRPAELARRLPVCDRIAAAIGKPVLAGPLDFGAEMRFADYFGADQFSIVQPYNAGWNDPVWRLAAFLSLGKKEAQVEYPQYAQAGHGRVSAAAGGNRGRAGERGLLS